MLIRGIIDPTNKNYETARKKYHNAVPIVHLIDPVGQKKVIYDALERMIKLHLFEFTEYDGKDYLMLQNKDGEYEKTPITEEEQITLTNINLAKTEMSYICRYTTSNGGVQYELSRDKKNKMGDDRADTMAMGAFGLATLRREDILDVDTDKPDISGYAKSLAKLNHKPIMY